MPSIQTSLARLGLASDADERAVRRAYAQLLKASDPEADPRGFQSLREAYEAALAWAKRKPAAAKPSPPPTTGFEMAALPQPGVAVEAKTQPKNTFGGRPAQEQSIAPIRELASASPIAQRTASNRRRAAAPKTATSQQGEPSDPNPRALSDEVFQRLKEQTRTWPGRVTPRIKSIAKSELEQCLSDPRLVNLAARRFFEQRIVDHLGEGPSPGRKLFLATAARGFGWVRDRKRLNQFGAAGKKLNLEIDSTSLSVMGEKTGFWATFLEIRRFRKARQKRHSKWRRILWVVAAYALLLILKILFDS